MQETGLILARQVENIPGPHRADVQRLRTEPRVIGRARRGGEVEQIVDGAEVERLADILFYQREPRILVQVGQVGRTPGGKIVYPHYMVALGKKGIAQMRAEEAGGAGNQDTMSRQNTVSPVLRVDIEIYGQRLVDADSTEVC
jgi:hypothetical protein